MLSITNNLSFTLQKPHAQLHAKSVLKSRPLAALHLIPHMFTPLEMFVIYDPLTFVECEKIFLFTWEFALRFTVIRLKNALERFNI